ncbi:MAG: adenylyltransferase/cytidyltransferase family protein [Rickettsiales bacterium]|jgi:glycerol-3-phosphate cytidylyltransferase|nr:adenylyltransferase/cytidyltransferase family protein [Rickettsiales bacterium]
MITGLLAGTFDLFHVGHLDTIKRMKERCDNLIVAIYGDDDVLKRKGHLPIVPQEQRMEILKSIRYVDDVCLINMIYLEDGTEADWYGTFQYCYEHISRYDLLFAESDYFESESALKLSEYLKGHGSEIVFFTYTKGISSTEIRKRCVKSFGENSDIFLK